jgi:DNA transposition AAA+ family ATPase
MTEKTYPAHYTAADIALIERAQAWMAERKFSQAAMARLSRVAPSTLNQILHGGYATSPSKQLASVESAMLHADETNSDSVTPVETSVFKLAQTCCKTARRNRNFAVLSAYVGTGKTFAIKHYAATHSNTHLIEATPTMTPQSLIKDLSVRVAGFSGKGGMADRFNAVVEALKNTDSLLIVDEAETLTPHQLHTLRRLRDLANVGILLVGTEHLTGLIKPAHGQFDQIRSRVGFWPETVRTITQEDAAALVQAGFGTEDVPDEVVQRLYQYCKGSARMLVEGLIASMQQMRKGRALTRDMVDYVAKQALCLQSLA